MARLRPNRLSVLGAFTAYARRVSLSGPSRPLLENCEARRVVATGLHQAESGRGDTPAFRTPTRLAEFGSARLAGRPSLSLSNRAPGLGSALLADIDDVNQAVARVDRLA